MYDVGIHHAPDFGEKFAQPPFDCEVHAFDPSPVTTKAWAGKNKHARRFNQLRTLRNYHMHGYGAGGEDGNVYLSKYNWQQVSIMRADPYRWCVNNTHAGCGAGTRPPGDAGDGLGTHSDVRPWTWTPLRAQQRLRLPVKTLPTMMQELGHHRITILKVDIEGSEYLFLQQMLDSGICRRVDQLVLEWHHFSWDGRYGAGASPDTSTALDRSSPMGGRSGA